MTIWVRALSSVPISGRARMPSHSSHDRRGEFEQFLLLAADQLFPSTLVAFDRVQAELVEQDAWRARFLRQPIRIGGDFPAQQLE